MSAIIQDSSFYYNSGGEGGGIGCGGPLKVENSTFYANKAIQYSGSFLPAGGAIGSKSCTAEINNSTFKYNYTANAGGAIDTDMGVFTITNSTFNGNRANKGGAIMNTGTARTTINNSTIAFNRAGDSEAHAAEGSGIANEGGTLTLQNSIVANNRGASNCFDQNGTLADGGGNIRWPRADQSCPGKAGNPLLAPLDHYGGQTTNFALLPGSAAIGAADEETCAENDQRGVQRALFGPCDAGSFQSRGFKLIPSGGNYQFAKTNTAFKMPLAVAIVSRYSEPVDGGHVWYLAPKSGASIRPVKSVEIIKNGAARLKANANGTAGIYNVVAQTGGGKAPVVFHLSNIQ